jgi:hypothetical protein
MLEAALRRLVELTVQLCGGREERSWIAGAGQAESVSPPRP